MSAVEGALQEKVARLGALDAERRRILTSILDSPELIGCADKDLGSAEDRDLRRWHMMLAALGAEIVGFACAAEDELRRRERSRSTP